MSTHDRLEMRQWLLDHRAYVPGDAIPIRVDMTNWIVGGPWSADISVRYDGHDEVSAELVIRAVAGGFLVDVHGKRIRPLMEARYLTLHAAQLAAEKYALEAVHRVPEAA